MYIKTTTAKRLSAAGAILAAMAAAALAAGCSVKAEPIELGSVACESPPPLHCPDADCPADLIANPGNATDPKTQRQYFLDYPCDLKAGEEVLVVLSLHGGGSIGNWQRHYFPLMDYKDQYRLVILTPSGTNNGWRPDADDAYLHNIVTDVYDQLAANDVKVKAFWLAGHSLGGQTSNRLINDDPFFRDKLTGWVSLSGGRLGSKREEVRASIPLGSGGAAGAPPPPRPGAPMQLVAYAENLPDIPFSFIYESGGHELPETGLPGNSHWAEKLGCEAQTRAEDVVDTKPGYVYDTREQANQNPVWGGKPMPGTADVYVYPNCKDGRVVADIIREGKGHTEGLEPEVTEAIVKMMVAAS